MPSGPTGNGSIADSFLLFSLHENENGQSRHIRNCVVSRHELADRERRSLLLRGHRAITVSPTGRDALVRPVIFSVVAVDLEDPIEDLLFLNVGSTSDVCSDMAFFLF